eukprot:scaffold23273_cov72-Phaeocystis_antarctica.AAC.3
MRPFPGYKTYVALGEPPAVLRGGGGSVSPQAQLARGRARTSGGCVACKCRRCVRRQHLAVERRAREIEARVLGLEALEHQRLLQLLLRQRVHLGVSTQQGVPRHALRALGDAQVQLLALPRRLGVLPGPVALTGVDILGERLVHERRVALDPERELRRQDLAVDHLRSHAGRRRDVDVDLLERLVPLVDGPALVLVLEPLVLDLVHGRLGVRGAVHGSEGVSAAPCPARVSRWRGLEGRGHIGNRYLGKIL